jgi:hypothetical protein
MVSKIARIPLCSLALLVVVGSMALGQSSNTRRSINSYIGRGNAQSSILNRPTVSPYLRLLQNQGNPTNGLGSSTAVYQTQVRPQLERRQQSAQQQQQMQRMQSQLNQVRQQFTQPNSGLMTTGHPTRFMSYSHYYYPGLGVR